MGRPLSAPLALIFYTLARFTCALSAHNITSEYIPRRSHDVAESFVSASMSLREIHLVAGYCCDLFCFCAEVDNATAERCGAIEDRVAMLPPSVCASTAQNSSSMGCPPSGAAGTLCNGGASCCTNSCIKPCTSKPCACPCNHCSTCSCCKRLKNRLCQLQCWPCDKVQMMLDFQDQQGKPHSVNFSMNFSFNSAESRNFYSAHLGMPFIIGFFKLDDPNIVEVYNSVAFLDGAEEFPVASSWAAFDAFTVFPIFSVGVILTGLLIALLLQKMGRGNQRPFRIAWSVNRGLWMGIIWPLIILLLILQVRHPVMRRGTTLSILFPQALACVGWLPLLLLWLYHIMHPQR